MIGPNAPDIATMASEPIPPGWFLCPESEEYFQDAVRMGRIVLLNINSDGQPTFAVKGYNRLAAICLNNVYDEHGEVVFERGDLCCPIEETREALRLNFGTDPVTGKPIDNQVQSYALNLPHSRWANMRRHRYPDGLIRQVNQHFADVLRHGGRPALSEAKLVLQRYAREQKIEPYRSATDQVVANALHWFIKRVKKKRVGIVALGHAASTQS